MTRGQHYLEAERLLAQAHTQDFDGYGAYLVARAQAHAILATVSEQTYADARRRVMDERDAEAREAVKAETQAMIMEGLTR